MSYRMIHAARRLMCDKFSILCTLAELNAKQEREDTELTKSSDKLEAALKRVAKRYDFSSEKWDDDYSLRQAEIKQLYELLAKNAKGDEGMRIRIKKVRDDIPTPGYAYKGDAGYDLIAAEDTIIEPGQTVKIPTGLAFEIAEGYEMQIRPRSGVTSKTKLRVQLGTIDSNFRGEVSVIVDNTANPVYTVVGVTDGVSVGYNVDEVRVEVIKKIDNSDYVDEVYHPLGTYIIRKGDKIAQGVIAPVVQARFLSLPKGVELGDTDRGTGSFGSSGVTAE